MSKASAYIKMITVITALLAVMQMAVFADETDAPFFVSDKAGVISDELESEITEKGDVILAQSGCRFAVSTVDFLGSKDIEQFSRELYEENGMGNNGVLLVVSVAEENYHIVQGEKLKDKLPDEQLKKLLDKYAEQPFEAGEYQAAIESVHREITKKLEDVFSITADKEQYEKKLEEIELANQNTAKMKKIYSAAAAVSAVLAVLFLIRMAVSFHYYFKRRAR